MLIIYNIAVVRLVFIREVIMYRLPNICIAISVGILLSQIPTYSFDLSISEDDLPITISYCELIRKPELYNNKVIRLKASYLIGPHYNILYSTLCQEKKTYLLPKLTCKSKDECKSISDIIYNKSSGSAYDYYSRRIGLVLIGRFRVIDDKEKQHLPNSNINYLLEIKEIEKYVSIPENIPWPEEKKPIKKRYKNR